MYLLAWCVMCRTYIQPRMSFASSGPRLRAAGSSALLITIVILLLSITALPASLPPLLIVLCICPLRTRPFHNTVSPNHLRIFSVMDISAAFWTVPIAEEFTDYRQRVGQFEVCPFGFRNSLAIFSNALDKALSSAPDSSVRNCDDIICHTDDIDQHEEDLRALLSIMRRCKLLLNNKSELFRTSVKYVGHMLSHNRICPIIEHDTIRSWPLQTSQSAI